MESRPSLTVICGFEDEFVSNASDSFHCTGGTAQVFVRDTQAIKSEFNAIELLLDIGVGWLVEKFIIEPTFSRLKKWWDTVLVHRETHGMRNRISTIVRFDGPDEFEIAVTPTSSSAQLQDYWQQIEDIFYMKRLAAELDFSLDKVRLILGDGIDPITVGYRNGVPFYLIDLKEKTFRVFEAHGGTAKDETEVQLWLYEQQLSHLHYRLDLIERGMRSDSDEVEKLRIELQQLRTEIEGTSH